ncbi:hypothetical protein [Facklamia hominis]|uniref:hypothetical protein n=1 Tax=Facklamia hominis TaxID=178214 RepID=UPI000352CC75|nr:hypothetical protein [Facklamia hominis]EPH07656.1 hypothetical protein HMPREF9260_01653 [Facklamia hominis ACS-120-V-Sch10]WPJ90894.1 hypothetical protein R0V13_00370 [Facklamia hominis]
MSRLNVYVHYDSVTNHFMTRGVRLNTIDFLKPYMPQNIILADEQEEFGRFDIHTNFKILKGQTMVADYFDICFKEKRRMSNWIDFDSVEMMHQLTPIEISEILYLFHATKALRSPFFYKLQNNFVYLNMPNGLTKTYYRHMTQFYPRFQRSITGHMQEILNERISWFNRRKIQVERLPQKQVERLSPLFLNGIKFDFNQAYENQDSWHIPLFVIEDELTQLTRDLPISKAVADLAYCQSKQSWTLELYLSNESESLEEI